MEQITFDQVVVFGGLIIGLAVVFGVSSFVVWVYEIYKHNKEVRRKAKEFDYDEFNHKHFGI